MILWIPAHNRLWNVTPDHYLFNDVIHMWFSAFWIPRWWQPGLLGNERPWVRPHAVSTQTKAYLELSFGGGDNIINLQRHRWLQTLADGPRLLWQLFLILFRIHKTCCHFINQVSVFQGESSILGNTPSPPGAKVPALSKHSGCSAYWLVDCPGLHLG